MSWRTFVAVLPLAGLMMAAPMEVAAAPWSAPAASATFTSSIYSAATSTCADVPGGTTDINTDVIGAACDGSAEQTFTFVPVDGAPAGTYAAVNQASGLCLFKFRFGIRQTACQPGTATPYQSWTLVAVDATAKRYQFVPTYQFGNTTYRCMGAVNVQGNVALQTPFCSSIPEDSFVVAGIG